MSGDRATSLIAQLATRVDEPHCKEWMATIHRERATRAMLVPTMLKRIIEWSVANKLIVALFTAAAIAGGVFAIRRTPLEALPDLSDVQVIVQAEYNEQAPRIVNGVNRLDVEQVERAESPLTLIPSYPDLPMEKVYPRVVKTEVPQVYLREAGQGRVVDAQVIVFAQWPRLAVGLGAPLALRERDVRRDDLLAFDHVPVALVDDHYGLQFFGIADLAEQDAFVQISADVLQSTDTLRL